MMTRYFLRRPVTLTLSREQVLLGLKVYTPNIPFIKRPLRSPLKRVRQKLSFALAELNAPARQKEAPIILTELEIVAFRYYTEIASDFSNDDNWPKFTALSNALRFAALEGTS